MIAPYRGTPQASASRSQPEKVRRVPPVKPEWVVVFSDPRAVAPVLGVLGIRQGLKASLESEDSAAVLLADVGPVVPGACA